MKQSLKMKNSDILNIIKYVARLKNVSVERDLFDLGIGFLERGGDFADGVIAYHASHNNPTLLTFDKNALKLAEQLNMSCLAPT